jgi:TonB family protein
MRQFRIPEEAKTAADQEIPTAAQIPRDNPLELLRDAIAQLKSPAGAITDQQQVANLLAEAREALEHASVVARAVAQCDAHLSEDRFEQALEALDEGLHVYPDDRMLAARRRAAEQQQIAFCSAAAVRGAIEEAKWLLDHDRTDLAAQFLKEKAAELPDQEELTIRLAELEALLPEWEQRRYVQDALARAQTLEQLEQWQAALTVVEEAQQRYSSSPELHESAERIRRQLVEYERRKKLARRIELIRQRMADRSWRQALTLLENIQGELSGTDELKPLRREIMAGLRRAECDEAVAEVRKCLADGELEQAERLLNRGLEALGAEPTLEAVRHELEAEAKYRDQLRHAQVLFGRQQLEEAERVLMKLLDPDRGEPRALLEAVRAARAATEEENFLEQGRERALILVQQQQFAQAVDLLRNLLSLFPGNPILERDLLAAQAGLKQASVAAAPEAETIQQEAVAQDERAPDLPNVATGAAPATGRFRRAAIAGTASLALVSAAGTAWKLTHRTAPAPRPAVVSPATSSAALAAPAAPVSQPPAHPAAPALPAAELPATPAPTPPPQVPARVRPAAPAPSKPANAATPRPFTPPNPNPGAAQKQNAALPLPPGTNPAISVTTIPGLPAGLDTEPSAPAPPTVPPVDSTAPAPPPAKPALPAGGKLVPAQLVSRVLPTYSELARQRAATGVVRLTADIDEHGVVKNVKVLSGDPILGTAAKNAVVMWKYKPATLNGQPVSTPTEIQFVFGDRGK